jgi:hypothetical protein
MKLSTSTMIFIMAFCFGCKVQKASQTFIDEINKPIDTINLFDRVYYHIRDHNYNYPIDPKSGIPTKYIDTAFLDQPVFFTKKGIVLSRLNLTILKATDFEIDSSKAQYKNNTGGWGIYQIKNDTIKATIYIDFMSGGAYARNQFYECNYQGVLKNQDTLLNWHMVEPYPNINKTIPGNLDYFDFLKQPVDLFIKKVDVNSFIDPSISWIYKYKVK